MLQTCQQTIPANSNSDKAPWRQQSRCTGFATLVKNTACARNPDQEAGLLTSPRQCSASWPAVLSASHALWVHLQGTCNCTGAQAPSNMLSFGPTCSELKTLDGVYTTGEYGRAIRASVAVPALLHRTNSPIVWALGLISRKFPSARPPHLSYLRPLLPVDRPERVIAGRVGGSM